MVVQVNEAEIGVDRKLDEAKKMFSGSSLDQIKAEKEALKRELQLLTPTVEVNSIFYVDFKIVFKEKIVDSGPTQEELEMEAERDEIREMLFGIRPPSSKSEKKDEEPKTDSFNEWIVPADWATQQTEPPKFSHKVLYHSKLLLIYFRRLK